MEWDKIFQTFGTFVVGPIVLGSIIYAIGRLSEYLKERKKRFSIKITADKNDRIQQLLTELRVRTNADRAYMAMFHNGTKYIDGSEVLKMSRTNESASPGVSLEAQHYQNMNISLVPDEMKLIGEDGPSFRFVTSLDDGKFKRMCVSRGIKGVARCAIRKGPKEIIGFLGLDYSDIEETPPTIEDLCKYSGIVEQVLSSYA